MVCAVMVFRGIIPEVLLPGVVFNIEQFLCLMAQQPKISHVHCTRTLSFDCVRANAHHRDVIAMYGGGWLGMANFFQCESHHFCFDCIEEEGPKFCFCRGRGDTFEDGAVGENGAIKADGASVFWEGAEEEVARGAATGFWCSEVGSVAVHVEDHV